MISALAPALENPCDTKGDCKIGYPVTLGQTYQPLVFFLASSADHITGAPGLNPTVTIAKNGSATFATPAGAVSNLANGWYAVAGNASDEDTLGPLLLHATAPGADPVDDCFPVVAYSPLDAQALGLALIDAAVTSRLAEVPSAATIAAIYALLLGQGRTFTFSPPVVTSNGTTTIIQGNDYLAADGLALVWTLYTSVALTSATATLYIYNRTGSSSGQAIDPVTCTLTLLSAGTWSVSADLTDAQTERLTTTASAGLHGYVIKFLLTDDSLLTLIYGYLNVISPPV